MKKEELINPKVVRPARKRMTAQEAKEFDDSQVEEFNLDSLAPADRKRAKELAAAGSAMIMKGLLNRLDPKAFPVPRDAASPEAKAATLAKQLSPRAFARLAPHIERAAKDPARISRTLGVLRNVDLRKADLTPDFGSLASILRRGPLQRLDEEVSVAKAAKGARFNRMHFVLRGLHCVDETNPEGGNDDMVLGGVLIGASGRVAAFPGVVCGTFNDGEYQSFGELFLGTVSLNSTPGYPKSFYAIFKLVESDSDDREVAQEMTATLSLLARTILSVVATPVVGQVAGAVVSAVGGFISNIMDEDEFPPYGVRVTLNSENQFGGPTSPRLRTGDIRGHGGKYRIGYRVVLNA
ncbi:MAG TPA: hypothetical protein VFX96_01580 [Pyrinomonadaceae bacterium]|nr:hypothetical protein [Pyrinomonadaceae bacterium]